ncbi:short chain dehydrogenase [Gordonia westfalica]|uniref:Short chain dehydrogenase n=1 Tax=Gordonia westfalica TaxID=158898 RepID=A0A1H2LI16_9ACTN|nr:short chain dehydrogenase [Gordonia westfalica]
MVERTVAELGGLNILVNNVAYQEVVDDFMEVDPEQWYRTFDVNIHSFFHTTRAAVPHLTGGGAIINTSSINGLRGNDSLIDYSATKGAVLALTYSLAQSLMERRIRVNCVAPGPVWTPLIPATMPAEAVKDFGTQARWAVPPSPMRSRRRTCSSRPSNCRRTTPVRCSLRSVAKRSRGEWFASRHYRAGAVSQSGRRNRLVV